MDASHRRAILEDAVLRQSEDGRGARHQPLAVQASDAADGIGGDLSQTPSFAERHRALKFTRICCEMWPLCGPTRCTRRRRTSNEVIAVVQINGIFPGTNWENFSRTHRGGAALRPCESSGMAFAGRWSPAHTSTAPVVPRFQADLMEFSGCRANPLPWPLLCRIAPCWLIRSPDPHHSTLVGAEGGNGGKGRRPDYPYYCRQ